MDSYSNSSSLWDSSHDWILQYDNILKGNVKNNAYIKGKLVECENLYLQYGQST